MMFCDIIHQVFPSLLPEYADMIFSYYVYDPIRYHVYYYGYFCFSVTFRMLFAAVFTLTLLLVVVSDPFMLGQLAWMSIY